MARVLIVDDERDVRFLLSMLFETSGLEVDEAENGEIALTKLEAGGYDVVVLDVMMPLLDGWGVLRGLGGRPDQPPILMLTAHATSEDRLKAIELGATAFMNKPFDPDQLAELVEQLATATPEEIRSRKLAEMEEAKRR